MAGQDETQRPIERGVCRVDADARSRKAFGGSEAVVAELERRVGREQVECVVLGASECESLAKAAGAGS